MDLKNVGFAAAPTFGSLTFSAAPLLLLTRTFPQILERGATSTRESVSEPSAQLVKGLAIKGRMKDRGAGGHETRVWYVLLEFTIIVHKTAGQVTKGHQLYSRH